MMNRRSFLRLFMMAPVAVPLMQINPGPANAGSFIVPPGISGMVPLELVSGERVEITPNVKNNFWSGEQIRQFVDALIEEERTN